MPKIVYKNLENQTETEVVVADGWTVMEGAIQNDVDGILAECGGGCACAATRARRNPSPPCCNGDAFRGQRDGQREKSLQKVSLSYVKTLKARSEARDLESSSLWPRSCIVP